MSIICAICQKKQSGWIQDFPLSDENKDLRICSNCYEQMQIIVNSDQQKNVDEAKDYFREIFLSVNVCDEVKTTINEAIYSREYAAEEAIKTKKREEAEKAEAQRLEYEELERIRIINEENVRKEREERHRVRLEKLKERGADGYYEYKAISLLDASGLFSKNSGKVDTMAMTEILNELGLDGWHLVTAYSNELGKNALSGGVGEAILGVNSTVDENILIFERFVKI